MTRLDLAFFLCCCKACLGSSAQEDETLYDLLGVEPDASKDELKRAYKKKSLQMHPDKLAQKGQTVTEQDQAMFTRMKEAYECLSDQHKRETYDAIGERGMKWVDEPFSADPQEMAQNFATSSTLDRAKIFSILVFVAVVILIQPILICLQLDGKFGMYSKWTAVLTPLWIWNTFVMFYFTRVILMGEIPKPDHIPEADWKDPLPMHERIIKLLRFLLFFAFEVQLALHLDGVNKYSWSIVLLPLFFLEASTMFKKFPESRVTIVTVEEIQSSMGKQISELSEAERKNIEKHYILVSSRTSAEFDMAQNHVSGAKREVMKIMFRVLFMVFVLLKLDDGLNWNWWLIFSPFFVTSLCICWGNLQDHAEVQAFAEEKMTKRDGEANATDYGAMEEGREENNEGSSPLSEKEVDEMRARLMQSSSRLLTTCCSQICLLIILCIGLVKIQGAGFSTFWLISPFLFIASMMLCFSGCMIFCVAPIDEDEMMFDAQNPSGSYYNMNESMPAASVPAATSVAAAAASPIVTPVEIPPTASAAAASPVIVPPAAKTENLPVSPSDEDKQPIVKEPITTPAKPQVDLLDIGPQPSDELREVVPTPSEVDDLD